MVKAERVTGRDYTVNELAKAAGVTPTRIRQLLLAGDIEGKRWGSAWVIKAQEAEKYLKERGRQ